MVSGFDLLSGGDCLVEYFHEVGLAVVIAPEPLHYYSLFSQTIGSDVVVSAGGDNGGSCGRGGYLADVRP